MPRYLLKRMDARRGEVAALYVDAASPEAALARAPAGCWKLHRRVDEDEIRQSRAGVILAPCFVPARGRSL